MSIRATAPCRIDLAGGTLDIHPLYLLLPHACTVNLAIDVRAEVEIDDLVGDAIELASADMGISWRTSASSDEAAPPGFELASAAVRHLAPEGGLAMRMRSHSPPRAGLGASSALCVALVSALLARRGMETSKAELAQLCLDLEAIAIGTPAGCQDHWASVNGGLQDIRFAPGGAQPCALEAEGGELRRRIVLAYTGAPHHSGLNNWEVYKRFIDGDDITGGALKEIGYIAVQMAGAIRSGDRHAVGNLLGREWRQRKRLWPGVTTTLIDKLIAEAEALGGAGKVCGAGGGGSVILWHPGDAQCAERLEGAVEELGAELIEWHPSAEGCRVSVD